jgi:hypothetical protein
MQYQLKLQIPGDSLDDYDAMIALESELIEELGDSADVDGHDVGSGETNIFIFTSDPSDTFDRIRRILEQRGHLPAVTVAYREVNGERYTVMWPEGSQGEFTAGDVVDSQSRLLGCFVSGPTVRWDEDQETKDTALERGELFRAYIWGADGICNTLKKLYHSDYGSDLVLILFQFYVNPIPEELAHLKRIESYRKNERSIGIPIVVNEDNFFNKPETEKRLFLTNSVFEKLSLLEEIVKKRKLDTDIGKLRKDLETILL